MSIETLNDIFFAIAGRNQPRCMLRRTEAEWQPISSGEFAAKVSGVAQALRSWGISRGDRVAILSENRHEWAVADFACMLLGAVVVPIYTTLTPEQTAYILSDSGARAIFVSSQKHLEKVLPVLQKTNVEQVAVMDDVTRSKRHKHGGADAVARRSSLEILGRSRGPSNWPPLSILPALRELPRA